MSIQFKKRLKAVFIRPERKLVQIDGELWLLREFLAQTPHGFACSLKEIVKFFDTISKWHDRGIDDIIVAFEQVNYGQFDEVLRNLRVFKRHLENAGRSENGMNRTRVGETVTADHVFLGNIHGLFTYPVTFWEQKKDEKKGGWGDPGMESLNAYQVVWVQAFDFMISHTRPMVKIIDYLRRAA